MERAETARPRWHDPATIAVAALLAVTAVAAVYEALFALGVIGFPAGAESMTSPRLEIPILNAATLGMLAASVGFVAAIGVRRWRSALVRVPALPLVPLVAGALLVARCYTYDPYYLPDLERGSVAATNVPFVFAALGLLGCLGVKLLAPRAPRLTMLGLAVAMFVAAAMTVIINGFH